jgi:hypothetical protein
MLRRVVSGAVMVGFVYLLVQNTPDIVRYLKIRSM